MRLILRRATPDDKPRILEIVAQIWEGDDDVPAVIDGWLADENGEVTVAALDGEVISFAGFSWLLPGYAWFEGLRTEPTRRNIGAAKAIIHYFLDKARAGGAQGAGLRCGVQLRS
jgi:GNAT superfamily N-acetyltransferase